MSAGMGLFVYGIGAFFLVIMLFVVCMAADSMGRHSINIFKKFAYRDGVGNVSLLTEIVVFIIVLIVVGVILHASFMKGTNTPDGVDDTSCTPLKVQPAAPLVSGMLSPLWG